MRAAAITRVPLRVYWALIHAHLYDGNGGLCLAGSISEMPYVMERAWIHLWGANATFGTSIGSETSSPTACDSGPPGPAWV